MKKERKRVNEIPDLTGEKDPFENKNEQNQVSFRFLKFNYCINYALSTFLFKTNWRISELTS